MNSEKYIAYNRIRKLCLRNTIQGIRDAISNCNSNGRDILLDSKELEGSHEYDKFEGGAGYEEKYDTHSDMFMSLVRNSNHIKRMNLVYEKTVMHFRHENTIPTICEIIIYIVGNHSVNFTYEVFLLASRIHFVFRRVQLDYVDAFSCESYQTSSQLNPLRVDKIIDDYMNHSGQCNMKNKYTHIKSTPFANILCFESMQDALQFSKDILIGSNKNRLKTRGSLPYSIIMDIDETCLIDIDDLSESEVNSLMSDTNECYLKTHIDNEENNNTILLRLYVLSFLQSLLSEMKVVSDNIYAVSARTEHGRSDKLDAQKQLIACNLDVEYMSLVDNLHLYPGDHRDHETDIMDYVWAFKKNTRHAIKQYTECIVEIGDNDWDVMFENDSEYIQNTLRDDEKIETYTFVTVNSNPNIDMNSITVGIKLPSPLNLLNTNDTINGSNLDDSINEIIDHMF